MRDPKRIDPMINVIREVWRQHPDWRFGQLVVNMSRDAKYAGDLFYLEDEEMMRYFMSLETFGKVFGNTPRPKMMVETIE